MTPLLAQRPRTDRAFERLYQKHVHAVYRYSLAVLHNQADAEDITQITFLSAYRAFSRGERPERPHNWLIKIAHNACRQRFRDAQRRPQEVALVAEDAFAAPTPDEEVPTADEIRRALGFLSFNQRAALVMRELEGRTYVEIGQILDLSNSAVETLLFRARRALREQLEGGLSCEQTAHTLSLLNDGRLSNAERGALRAHLRECKDCAALERRRRAQRAAFKNLAAAPLPASLTSFIGSSAVGGGAAVGGLGLGAKSAAVLAAGIVSAGLGNEAIKAVAAKEQPSAVVVEAQLIEGRAFSPVSRITGGRAMGNPLVERAADLRQGAEAALSAPRTNRRRGMIEGADSGAADDAQPASQAAAPSAPAREPPVREATNTATQKLPIKLPPAPPPPPVPVPVPPPPTVTLPVPLPPPPPLPPVPPLPPPPPPPLP